MLSFYNLYHGSLVEAVFPGHVLVPGCVAVSSPQAKMIKSGEQCALKIIKIEPGQYLVYMGCIEFVDKHYYTFLMYSHVLGCDSLHGVSAL